MIVAATGHRPDKLGGYGTVARVALTELAAQWIRSNRDEVDEIVSGMALGWDTAVASSAIETGIPPIAALPCDNQAGVWPRESQQRWEWLVDRASDVIVVSPGPYAAWKMQARNQYMVKRAQKVLALWNGSDGGAVNCISYAEKLGRPIVNLWSEWEMRLV